ncbi:MAG: T9SS type A sorting domain-containing protein [Ignavibacteriaceae bacterium]
MSVENINKENPDKIEFDIFLKSTGDIFLLESYQVTLGLTPEIQGELSFSYIEGTSELYNIPTYGIGIYNTDGNSELAFASSPAGTDTITSEKKRVGKFSLTSTEDLTSVSLEIQWNFEGTVSTILTTSGNIDFTNQLAHSIFTDDEPPLPVELSVFAANVTGEDVILKWRTETELNNFGFEIERSVPGLSASGSDKQQWGIVGFIRGNGNSSIPIEYQFVDESPESGKWLYRLKQIDHDGTFSYSEIVEAEINSMPNTFNLSQNYPNPFNPETVIEFTIPENGNAVLKVFSITGEEVATLFDEFAEAGKLYNVRFSAEGGSLTGRSNYHLSAGIYFARLQFGDQQMIKKMTYLK